MDRSGRRLETIAQAADYVDFRLSPDGKALALSRTAQQTQAPDIWIADLVRGTERRVTTTPLTDTSPLWSPTGDRLIFRANNTAARIEFYRSHPGSGAEPEVIWGEDQQLKAHGEYPSNMVTSDWSHDGKYVVYHATNEKTGFDVWALPLDGDRTPIVVARSSYNESQGQLSSDGHWIAYASDESGRYEVYVQPFPNASVGPKRTVSRGGGTQPRWSANGRELFYVRGDGMLVSATIISPATLALGPETPLFKTVMKVPVVGTAPPSITVILNWPALLKK
jgi:Tol biopolymer transport system component